VTQLRRAAIADYGLVADLFQALREWAAELEKLGR